MSGHSRWSNIKHRKAKGDAAKAKIYTKIGRELAVVVKQGGADPVSNSRLRDVIAKARVNNIPNDNITRIIKKASGELGTINYEDIVYEGYGAGGSAVIVETLTDNRNRTAGDLRHFFDKYGGSLGTTGCVSFMFDSKGMIVLERGDRNEDDIMELALECGVDDYNIEDDIVELVTDPQSLDAVREALEAQSVAYLSASIERVPQNYVNLEGDNLTKFLTMLDKLEENDDVQEVYHNAILPDDAEAD